MSRLSLSKPAMQSCWTWIKTAHDAAEVASDPLAAAGCKSLLQQTRGCGGDAAFAARGAARAGGLAGEQLKPSTRRDLSVSNPLQSLHLSVVQPYAHVADALLFRSETFQAHDTAENARRRPPCGQRLANSSRHNLFCPAGRQGGGVGAAPSRLQAGRAAGGRHAGHVDAASCDAAKEWLVRSSESTGGPSFPPDCDHASLTRFAGSQPI